MGSDDQAIGTTTLKIAKRAKTGSITSKASRGMNKSTKPYPAILNKVPTEKLTVLVFGDSECGELGLGPNQTEAPSPAKNLFLDVGSPSAYHLIQLACGGLHVVALTADNKIVTWGVNDESAFGRDSHWDGDGDADLNALESVLIKIPNDGVPPATRFVQVAASENCSFALTDTGLVYGWGAFRNPQGHSGFRYDDRGELIEKQENPFYFQSLQ